MNWLRRLGMRIRGARQMRRCHGDYQPRHLKADCLPRTPPPPPADFGPWPPRITRWVRVTFPLPDDTMLLPVGTAAMVLELMARDFAWDPQ